MTPHILKGNQPKGYCLFAHDACLGSHKPLHIQSWPESVSLHDLPALVESLRNAVTVEWDNRMVLH